MFVRSASITFASTLDGSRTLRVDHCVCAADEANLEGKGAKAQGERARCAEVREAEVREVEAREAASRKAEARTPRAGRCDDADSVENVSVYYESERAATHTIPSSPARAWSAGLFSARCVGGAERGLYGENSVAARTRFCRRIQTAGEERLHSMENKFLVERERIAGADA
jgi:hypothetical protein